MNKKLSIMAATAFTALMSSEAFASKAGPYMGIQFGYVNTHSRAEGTTTTSAARPGFANRPFSRAKFNDGSFLTELLFGYLKDFSVALAGVEAAFGLDTQKQRKSITVTSTNGFQSTEQLQLQRKVASSISVITGTKLMGAFVFAKAGFGFSSYRTTQSTGSATPRKTETFVSFVPAAGVEYPIVAGLTARGEISYEMFRDKKVKALNDSVTGITSQFKHSNLRALAIKGGAVFHV